MSPALAGGFFTTEPPGSPAATFKRSVYEKKITENLKENKKVA